MTSSFPPASPRPFAAAPLPSRYFPASAIEEARQRINRSIQRGEGPVLIIGAAGLGKTMLLEVVAEHFRHQLRPVRLVGGQVCTRRALLQMILFQLDLPYREMDECELRLSLLSFLQRADACEQQTDSHRILLLVDEADALAPRLLEELRGTMNLLAAGQPLVSLILAGNSTLEEQFADPKLDLFSQRVSARCYLSAFSREETFHYVNAQVAAAATEPTAVFTADGLEAIFAATDGVPRLINQLGDQLQWMVTEMGYSRLDGGIVQQAWSELQQLPAPWHTETSEAASIPVEYGELDAAVGDFDVSEFDICNRNAHPSGLDRFDEGDSVADCYTDDFDDLPASIPINGPQRTAAATVSIDLAKPETLDTTEQLLQELNEMDAPPTEIDHTPTGEATSARNPFAEAFDSEEIVLDRYSTFESLLLAEAPRVANRSDAAFAEQLQQFEATEGVETSLVDGSPEVIVQMAEPESRPLDDEEPSESTFSNCESLPEPGEVLVIEDLDQGGATIVNGQRFRQLFSSLEQADGKHCFG